MIAEAKSRRYLCWGSTLFLLYIMIFSIQMPLMRLGTALKFSQFSALIFVGEAASLAPFAGVIREKWSILAPKEAALFATLSALLGAYIGSTVYCSQHMPIGEPPRNVYLYRRGVCLDLRCD